MEVLFSCNVILIFARQVGKFYAAVKDACARADTNKKHPDLHRCGFKMHRSNHKKRIRRRKAHTTAIKKCKDAVGAGNFSERN
jgi:hypothetical protein